MQDVELFLLTYFYCAPRFRKVKGVCVRCPVVRAGATVYMSLRFGLISYCCCCWCTRLNVMTTLSHRCCHPCTSQFHPSAVQSHSVNSFTLRLSALCNTTGRRRGLCTVWKSFSSLASERPHTYVTSLCLLQRTVNIQYSSTVCLTSNRPSPRARTRDKWQQAEKTWRVMLRGWEPQYILHTNKPTESAV